MTDLLLLPVTLFGIFGWMLYWRETKYRRDVLTDLVQLIHDHDLGRDDLRRSLGHEEVEQYLDRTEE